MDFIITFFRSIDGWLYYVMLVINTILIFAIIGYLGEKNNEQLLNESMQSGPSNLKSGTMNLNLVHSSHSHNVAEIPKVNATQVTVPGPTAEGNSSQLSSVSGSFVQSSDSPIPNVVQSQAASSNAIPSIQGTQAQINPVNNEIDPNEKAPSILIINSSDVNKDVK